MSTTQQTASADDGPRAEQDDRPGRGRSLLPALLGVSVPIALFTLAVGYVAYDYSDREERSYEAVAQVVLSASTNFSPINTSFSSNDPDRYVENQAEIMTTLNVMDRAAAALADGVTGADLRGDIATAPSGARDVIVITAEAADPSLAARRADAVANAYAQFTTDEVRILADQAAQASAGDPALVQDIRARAATFGDGVSVIQPAAVPSGPASPTPLRNAYLAAAAAFLLSTGLALGWLSRRRPTAPDRLAADAGGPLLGEVPVTWFGPAAAPTQPGPAAYAMALQALRYRLPEGGASSVLLTAVGRGTSAASAVLGLAAADAAHGRAVVIVDATSDGHLLRRAGVPSPAVPLTAAWAAGKDLDGALSAVPALSGQHGGSVRVARVEGDDVTSSDVLRGSLTALLESADLVLVDAGPAASEATAFTLLGEVGALGAVVAVVHGKRDAGHLREFRRRLGLAGRECAGVLVTHRSWVPSIGRPSAGPAPADRPAPRAPAPAPDRGAATEPSVPAGQPS